MFKYNTPESCGISSEVLEKFVRHINENGYAMHSILMSRGEHIFMDGYWAPFDSESMYRMNSVTKSFVGIAVGLLIEEGRLSEDDKISKFFPEHAEKTAPLARELTVGDLLRMRTTTQVSGHWVYDRLMDRVPQFFETKALRPHDTMFKYDSPGSFVLGVIVEKLTGKPFIEYMKDRLLRRLGFSEDTCCIKGPDGYSWGDSGLLIKMRDLHAFAKFIMDGGVYNGERLMNEDFLRRATSKLSDTTVNGFKAHNTFGYGMQIWKTYEDGFAFFGMGDQLVICVPKKQFIFICTADNQENPGARPVIMDLLYHEVIKALADEPLTENAEAHKSLKTYLSGMKLVSLQGDATATAAKAVDGVTYTLSDNSMKIAYIKINIDEENRRGTLEYKNVQGEKCLHFGLCENVITEFPEEGYPDMQMNVPAPGNKYPCAVSAAWLEERKLGIRVQMIGRHLGGLFIAIGFSDDYREVGVHMVKNTRCFLDTYNGYAAGLRMG